MDLVLEKIGERGDAGEQASPFASEPLPNSAALVYGTVLYHSSTSKDHISYTTNRAPPRPAHASDPSQPSPIKAVQGCLISVGEVITNRLAHQDKWYKDASNPPRSSPSSLRPPPRRHHCRLLAVLLVLEGPHGSG